ncbi:PIN domain-containing protein [Actinosynnema sp. NPDC002837]
MFQRKRVTVVIDSNAVWDDWLLKRDAWTRLVILADHGLIEVCVPEVVVQELARGYKRTLNDLVAGLDKLKLDKLATLLGLNLPSNVADLNDSTAEKIAAYEPALRARLAELRVTTLSVPEVDQQTMLTRALEARKPFDAEGKKGFRDALIWHTVLTVCRDRSANAKIMFVTDNIKDFCDATGKLHEVLIEEVAATGSLPMETVRSLNAAVQHLKDVEQLDAELALDEFPVVTPTREQVEAIVVAACEQLTGQSVTTAEVIEYRYSGPSDFSGFDTIIEDEADLQEIQPDLETIEWGFDGRDLDGRPMLKISLDAGITLDGMAYKADYYGVSTSSVYVLDGDWNKHYMWVATYHRGRLSLLVYLTADGTNFDAVELVNAEEIVPEAIPEH